MDGVGVFVCCLFWFFKFMEFEGEMVEKSVGKE